MPFRSITAEPQELQTLCNAFDAAWSAVTAARPIAPLQAAAEKERLGYIITQRWQNGPAGDLAGQAVTRFLDGLAGPPRLPDASGSSSIDTSR